MYPKRSGLSLFSLPFFVPCYSISRCQSSGWIIEWLPEALREIVKPKLALAKGSMFDSLDLEYLSEAALGAGVHQVLEQFQDKMEVSDKDFHDMKEIFQKASTEAANLFIEDTMKDLKRLQRDLKC